MRRAKLKYEADIKGISAATLRCYFEAVEFRATVLAASASTHFDITRAMIFSDLSEPVERLDVLRKRIAQTDAMSLFARAYSTLYGAALSVKGVSYRSWHEAAVGVVADFYDLFLNVREGNAESDEDDVAALVAAIRDFEDLSDRLPRHLEHERRAAGGVTKRKRGRPVDKEKQRLGDRIHKAAKAGTPWDNITEEFAVELTRSLSKGAQTEYPNEDLKKYAQQLNKAAVERERRRKR